MLGCCSIPASALGLVSVLTTACGCGSMPSRQLNHVHLCSRRGAASHCAGVRQQSRSDSQNRIHVAAEVQIVTMLMTSCNMHDFTPFLLHCRVHREGEQSARVERGSTYNRRSNQAGSEEERSRRRSSGGWRHHSEKPAHRQALDSHPHQDQPSGQQQRELLPSCPSMTSCRQQCITGMPFEFTNE